MNKTMMISAALLSALAGLTATAQNPGVAAFKPFSAQVKMTSYDDQGVLSPLSISWFEGGWKDGSRVETRTSSKGYTSRSLDLYDPKQGVFIHVLANDKNNLISTYRSGRAGVPRHRDRCAEFIPDDVISYTDSLLGFTAIHTVQEEEDGTQEMWYLPDLSCYRARESTRYKDSATGKYTGAIFVREAVSVSATEPDEALRKLPDNAQDVPPSQYHLAVTPESNCFVSPQDQPLQIMDCISALKTRRCVRAYTGEPVTREVLTDLVDCGRLAATAVNIQPWEFVVVTAPPMLRAIAAATDFGKFIAQAAACIVVLCRDTKYYLEDGCNASQNILVAAHAHGLGSCWIAGDKKPYAETVRRMVGAPEGCRLVSLLAIGHPAEKPEKTKRPLAELLHWEKF